MKLKKVFCLIIAGVAVSTSALAQNRRASNYYVDQLIRCQKENSDLKWQLSQSYSSTKSWSCQAGCQGLGNIGLGSGKTEAEARKQALNDLRFTCSSYTFDCHQE